MKTNIPFGKERLKIDIPQKNLLDIITSTSNPICENEHNIILNSLNNPVNSKKLFKIAKGKRSAAVIISDITRPCPSKKFLPYLIKEIKKAGIDIIKVISGLGIHRRHTLAEKIKLVGPYIIKNAAVMDSDPQRCKLIGTTSRGTPVEVFEEALGNDLLIVTGNIEYHYFAGYSGGAKAVMPGICSRNSIQANHSMMLNSKAHSGSVEDNPVREDIEEAGQMADIDFVFNVILDDNKNIIDAVAGKNNDAWLEGIKRYEGIYSREVDGLADIVITSPGGYPKDINLYQSQKALENVKDIVKPGGDIILVASCEEGFGEDVFQEWMDQARDYNTISKRLKDKFVLGGHKAVAVSKVIRDKKVYLYSKFDRTTVEKMGFLKLDDVQSYLNKTIGENDNIKITVVPEGRFVKLRKDRRNK